MKRLYLQRLHQPRLEQTIGVLTLYDTLTGVETVMNTLELPNLYNRSNMSRIPSGPYLVKLCDSGKYKGKGLTVMDMSGSESIYGKENVRRGIRFHAGNYNHQIEGCILTGYGLSDINGDGLQDVTSSTDSINDLMQFVGDEVVNLLIIDEF